MRGFVATIFLLMLSVNVFAADCARTGSVCADATPCKTISGAVVCLAGATVPAGGIGLTDSCWQYTDTYNCAGAQTDDCQPLRDRGCGQVGSTCLTYAADGTTCTMFQQTYQCLTTPAQSYEVADCGGQMFCLQGNCFAAGASPDQDFARVIAGMEALREAGQYMDPVTLELFKGYDNRCTKGYVGLKNCCKTDGSGAGMNNSSVFGDLAAQGLANAGGYAWSKASPYLFDAMFAADNEWLSEMAVKMWSPPTFNASFSLYGFTWTAGAMPETTMGLANISLADSGIEGFYFSPATFGIAVGMMVLQELISCTHDEQVLSMKRGQNLCHFVGSYCSQEIPIVHTCVETTDTYCCFTSRLARIVNEQGRAQLSKGWGGGESPDCSGFTPAQMQSLNFGTMDLSEFYAEIIPKTPDINAVGAQNQQILQQKVNAYYAH